MTIKDIEKTTLALNALDKIHLIEKLLCSLDKPDPEIEMAWIKEAEERFAAYEKGELNAISLEKVLKDIKRK